MRFSIIKFLLLLAVVVVCVGFYRGWFVLSSSNNELNNKADINLTVDKDKLREDAEALKRKSSELTNANKAPSQP